MGGLWSKLPITAATMLVGVIAIAGLAIPGSQAILGETFAFSGFHSKDAIVATALAYSKLNPVHVLLFITPLITAGITAFYMFRLWFMTFAGAPQDEHVYEHARENPAVMTAPLLVLSLLAATCAIGGESGPLYKMLAFSEPVPAGATTAASSPVMIQLPSHADIIHRATPTDWNTHEVAGALALLAAALGTLVAYLLYCRKVMNPAEIGRQFYGVYGFLVDKWRFDELYDFLFVKPAHSVARWCQAFDKVVLDGILHGASSLMVLISTWDRWFDERMVDGLVNLVGQATGQAGRSLRVIQTGRLRQYVMWIAVGVVVLFAALFTTLPK